MCDTKGVLYQGRTEGMNQWKSAHTVVTDRRTLREAMAGADIFVGLSVKGAVTPEMVASMAPNPIIFALANPDPEVTPEEVAQVRTDAIICTGRSDYPNQVNNVLGFPYIFRGALDVRATTVNDEMKLAAANALAELARTEVPDEVSAAYAGRQLQYGPNYVIPVPFDPRLIVAVSCAVAEAAMNTGVARKPITDWDAYKAELAQRLNPTAGALQGMLDAVKASPKRVVFAEGEEERAIRAALAFRNQGLGTPILIGREANVNGTIERAGIQNTGNLEIHNARISTANDRYAQFLYARLQRQGYLLRDCQRMVNQDRNVFAACMVALGDADAMVTGLTRSFAVSYDEIARVIPSETGRVPFGLTTVIARSRTVFIADTAVHELPTSEIMATIAEEAAAAVRRLGHEPRVAFISYSSFGNHRLQIGEQMREAVRILDRRQPAFEYDGEMAPEVALDDELMKSVYPFCRLTGPANLLIMPGLHSATIAAKLLQQLGGVTVIGPRLIGLEKPAQIVPMGASVSDIVTMAGFAAHDALV
jgi:malate dehydrogenase (oxaloacetate-decarboxylating)(NADP+)